MKKMFLLLSVCALAACSSNSKNEETATNDTATTEAAAASTTETEQAKAEPAQADSMTADSGSNMDGGFPDVEGTERSGATCKNGGDERMVSVIDTREGPCGVVYTKSGDKKTVAYAKHDMGFCDKVYNNIVSNLTSGGFDCGGAAVSAPSDNEEEASTEEETTKESAAE